MGYIIKADKLNRTLEEIKYKKIVEQAYKSVTNMLKEKGRPAILSGNALALALVKDDFNNYPHYETVITQCEFQTKYYSDWQEDGGFYHDEGDYDLDPDKDLFKYNPDDFILINANGSFKGIGTISRIEKVLHTYDLKEIDIDETEE